MKRLKLMKNKQAVNTHHEANYNILQRLYSFILFNRSNIYCARNFHHKKKITKYIIEQKFSFTQKRKLKHFILCYVSCLCDILRLFCFLSAFFLRKQNDMRTKENKIKQTNKQLPLIHLLRVK